MKTKKSIIDLEKYYVVAIFVALFFSSFFININSVKADECNDCVSEYGEGWCMENGFCANSTTEPYVNENPVVDNYINNGNYCENNYDTESCCQSNGGYWYNNTCNTNEKVVDNYQYYGNICDNKYDDEVCCKTNGGYWYGETCNSEPEGMVGPPNPLDCRSDSDCLRNLGDGYKCDSSGTCMVDGFFNGTECRSDADCDRYYGPGYECSGIFVSTCEKKTSTDYSGQNSNDTVATTTEKISLPNGTVAPSGTKVNSDGSGISPSGTIYPAGSFIVPGDVNSNFVMCAGGVLAAECRDANGNTIPSSPLIVSGGSNLGRVAGATGGPKCGANFSEIGGVCFPTNTGLSNAPIHVILSNIFSWMMGLFTTLAVVAFVISGIQYLMASGNEDLAKAGKKNASNALIGIIVGLSGFIIIQAIAAALSGQGYFF